MRDNTGSVAYLADQMDEALSARIFCLSVPQMRALSDISGRGLLKNSKLLYI